MCSREPMTLGLPTLWRHRARERRMGAALQNILFREGDIVEHAERGEQKIEESEWQGGQSPNPATAVVLEGFTVRANAAKGPEHRWRPTGAVCATGVRRRLAAGAVTTRMAEGKPGCIAVAGPSCFLPCWAR